MKTYFTYISIIITCLTSSCVSFEARKDAQYISKENYTLLNGTYTNCIVEEDSCVISSSDSFGEMLDLYQKNDSLMKRQHTQQIVSIRMITPKRLEVSLMQNDTLLKRKVLKGRFQNGNFKVRSRTIFLLGLPKSPMWGLTFSGFVIGKNNKNELYTSNSHTTYVFFLMFIPFAGNNEKTNTYKPL